MGAEAGSVTHFWKANPFGQYRCRHCDCIYSFGRMFLLCPGSGEIQVELGGRGE